MLVATLGPGVANAANVIANAWQDRVPLIYLTGCVDAAEAATYTHQIFDHRALIAPVAKASFTVVGGAVDPLIDKAVAIALDDQPGPVHLDLPMTLADTEQPSGPPTRRARPARSAPAPGAVIDAARRSLAGAKRPLMVAGLEAIGGAASAAVSELVQNFNIPLITTYKAKGILSEDHPLALGGAGLSPVADRILLPLVGDSDFVLLAGYDPIEMRAGWRNPWPEGASVVEFTSVPNTHYMHQAGMSFVGDVGAGIAALREGVTAQATWSGGEPAVARAALAEAFRDEGDWGPATIIETVRRLLPRDGIATVDSGAHRILLSQLWHCYEPRGLLQSMALCTMGCALPLAIGVKIAEPVRPVVCFTGDAGLEMVLGELATLRDSGLPVIVVVFADESLALIELKQQRAQLERTAVRFGGTDFEALAQAMGGHGVTVSSAGALSEAFETALSADRFTIIAARIDGAAYARLM